MGGAIMLAFVQVGTDSPVANSQPAVNAPAPPAPQIEQTPPPTWTGARRASWARDGSKTVVFTLAATHDVPVWMSRARPALVVRCLSRTTEAFVVLDTSSSFETDADRRTVRLQWDDGPVSTQRWAVSESARELFAPDGVAFVRQMVNAHALRFGFTPFNANPVVVEFAVQGFDGLGGLLASTCGWRLDERRNATN